METAKELTDKQARFIDEYLLCLNGTKAALRAGYAESGARQEGSRLLSNADIRAQIDERLKLVHMSADEAIKHISDVAQTRLNEFLKVETRQRNTTTPQSLHEAIAETQSKLWFEEEFLRRSIALLQLDEEAGEAAEAKFWAIIGNPLKLQILRWQMELEEDPTAFRLVAGTPEHYEAVDVDMVGLARAEDVGRIKSISFGEHGPKVEMYDALAANRDILKLAGRYVERTDVTSGGKAITAVVEIIASGPPLASNEKEIDDAL